MHNFKSWSIIKNFQEKYLTKNLFVSFQEKMLGKKPMDMKLPASPMSTTYKKLSYITCSSGRMVLLYITFSNSWNENTQDNLFEL